ncbi:T9SS type A sorting domain-containing protein [bacterium]|nr:T9SS type A sorting domain-containing protein [bacterium]
MIQIFKFCPFAGTVAVIVCLSSGPAPGDVDPALDARLERRSHDYQGTVLPYRLFVPDDYDSSLLYPMLIFYHGARWCGSDNVTQLDNEFAVYWVTDSVQVVSPCFVMYPQCPSGHSWESVSGLVADFPPDPEQETVSDCIDSLAREFSIDAGRIYMAGKSMGGQGVYGMLSRYPGRFAAAVIVAGACVYSDASDIGIHGLWILHAKFDDVIPVEQSRTVVRRLENTGKTVVYTHCDFHSETCRMLQPAAVDQAIREGRRHFYSEFDTSGHQVEPRVVRTYGLHHWMFSQRAVYTGIRSGSRPETVRLFDNYPNPFNQHTVIRYSLSGDTDVHLTIFNIEGRTVWSFTGGKQASGEHRVFFDAGSLLSGVYIAELRSGTSVRCIKISLVK